jgi:hypothetical protein
MATSSRHRKIQNMTKAELLELVKKLNFEKEGLENQLRTTQHIGRSREEELETKRIISDKHNRERMILEKAQYLMITS